MHRTFIDRALGSDIPYITYAVPVFFLLIGVELVVALWERKHFYRLHDSDDPKGRRLVAGFEPV